jgi:hypothetical protein
MKVQVLAKSSSGGAYEVDFIRDSGFIRVFCACKAGEKGQYCKHKIALILGDVEMLYNPSDAESLKTIRAWPEFKQLLDRLRRFDDEMEVIENEKKALAEKEKKIKSDFSRDLARGGQIGQLPEA